MFHQKQLADEIQNTTSQMISLITSSLNNHLNLNQSLIINTSSVYFLLEKIDPNLLSNRTINQISLPTNLSVPTNSTILLRVKICFFYISVLGGNSKTSEFKTLKISAKHISDFHKTL